MSASSTVGMAGVVGTRSDSHASPHLLLVDDEPAVARASERILRGGGFRVSVAGGGRRGHPTGQRDPIRRDRQRSEHAGCRRPRAPSRGPQLRARHALRVPDRQPQSGQRDRGHRAPRVSLSGEAGARRRARRRDEQGRALASTGARSQGGGERSRVFNRRGPRGSRDHVRRRDRRVVDGDAADRLLAQPHRPRVRSVAPHDGTTDEQSDALHRCGHRKAGA